MARWSRSLGQEDFVVMATGTFGSCLGGRFFHFRSFRALHLPVEAIAR